MEKIQRRTLRQMDRPCSSLCINCFQLGCCINSFALAKNSIAPAGAGHKSFNGNNADWISHLTKIRPSVKLRDLCMVGSHDAASSTIGKWKPFSAVAITQNASITQQLEMGVRYLDLRIAGSGKTGVSIFHGCLKGTTLIKVLKEIASFLSMHPGEVVIIELVAECGRKFSPEQKQKALQIVNDILGDYLNQDFDNSSETSTLKQPWKEKTILEMVKNNKRVILLVHPRIWSDNNISREERQRLLSSVNYEFYDQRESLYSKWHNTRDCTNLLTWNLEEVLKDGSDHTKILTNQLVLTPGVGSIGDVFDACMGTQSLRPISLVSQLIPHLTQFIRHHSQKAWNVLLMDFVDLVPALISFSICMNFVDTLHILKASASDNDDNNFDIDTTETIQQYICCDKVLYIINVVQDLNLPIEKGVLKIQYKLTSTGNIVHTLDVPFNEIDDYNQIVLSQYTHLLNNQMNDA